MIDIFELVKDITRAHEALFIAPLRQNPAESQDDESQVDTSE